MPYRLRHLTQFRIKDAKSAAHSSRITARKAGVLNEKRWKTQKRCYQVVNTQNGKIFSKCSTKKNAEKQMRLLRAIQYNKSFKPRNTQLANRTRRRRQKK